MPHGASTGEFGLLAAAAGLVAGLVLCFAGYRLLRAFAGFAGLLVGFLVGLTVGTAVGGPLVGLVVGVGVGILFVFLFLVAFGLAGALLGGALGATVGLGLALPTWMVVVLAAAGALMGLILRKPFIVGATAVQGGFLAAHAGADLLAAFDALPQARDPVVVLVGGAILALAGVTVQWRRIRDEA